MSISRINRTASTVCQVPDGRAACWWTTAEAARALCVTTEGVRHLVRVGQLACERTATGMRLFRREAVKQLADKREDARAGLIVVRYAGRLGGPRQLSLFGRARLRLVGADKSETSLEHPQAKVS